MENICSFKFEITYKPGLNFSIRTPIFKIPWVLQIKYEQCFLSSEFFSHRKLNNICYISFKNHCLIKYLSLHIGLIENLSSNWFNQGTSHIPGSLVVYLNSRDNSRLIISSRKRFYFISVLWMFNTGNWEQLLPSLDASLCTVQGYGGNHLPKCTMKTFLSL